MELDEIITWLIAIVMFIVISILTVGIIMITAFIIEWVIEMVGFNIDETLYWTGVGLIILFLIFCKTSSKDRGDM